jgi:hypothetical protein
LANLPNFFTFQFLHWPSSSKTCFYFELITPSPQKNKQTNKKKQKKNKNKTKTKNKQTKHVKTGVRCSLARLVSSEMSGNPNNYNSIKQTQMFAIVNWNWCYANNEN